MSLRTDIGRHVWASRYRHGEERDIVDTWHRVARAVASVECSAQEQWTSRFLELLEGFRFLPGGRILAGAGAGRDVTLMNCFVMGPLEDSIDGIFDALKAGAHTMRMGGGIGCDFSTLRPAGAEALGTGAIASGPVSFMRIWDSMCATLLSTGSRRGAMMATLRCDHPDIVEFVEAKRDPSALRNFNLSVQVTDAFMRAVDMDADWPLVFPAPGDAGAYRVVSRIPAAELWNRIMHAAYDVAEPGVLFIDTIARENNLHYRERLTATNPCGEIPLPSYGCCNLGSLNLTKFVRRPFAAEADVDIDNLRAAAELAVRFLDNVIDLSAFPLEQQAAQARATRRIGLGITGLADTLAMLGLHYDSDAARERAASLMAEVSHTAYAASIELAEAKGAFPALDVDAYLDGGFARRLPAQIRDTIREHGIRNSHLTAIAPTGTISLLADNVSSGIEPIYSLHARRNVLATDGRRQSFDVDDYAAAFFWSTHRGEPIPAAFVTASGLSPEAHVAMQAALQPHVDNAISKTVNVAEEFPFDAFRSLYTRAWRAGLKGCTAFRPNPVTGVVVEDADALPVGVRCCDIEREAD